MLPREARMRRSADFRETVRRGVRVGRPTLVVHARWRPADANGPVVGFVVSRAVGGAVVRNRVKRRLRHLSAARIAGPDRSRPVTVVVRALPAAAALPSRLADDFAGAWSTALSRVSGPATGAEARPRVGDQ